MRRNSILVVEDDPNDEELTLRALRRSAGDTTIVVVRDGHAALEYLFARGDYANREPTDPPRLVLLDLKLPKVNGLEVLRAVRSDARTALLPVIMFTSSKEEQDVLDSYRLGANSYVQKPVESATFLGAVRQLGVYWLALNERVPD